jgi:tetratricopeptide (TPR) repeat protein
MPIQIANRQSAIDNLAEGASLRTFLLICLALAIATSLVYLPVRNHDFVRYDDDVYVTENSNVLTGLTLQNIKWAFTSGHAANWHPLTWLSLMLDISLFGLKSGPMHLVNLAFHIANTLLLFIVFNRMTKRIWPSAFIAALFALHPLHVESVAWVAERKDVLSTLFWLLTMLTYVRYVEKPTAGRYIITLIVFSLGLMSKPMLVTLPFVLMLLDYWPLNRFLTSQFKILNSVIEKLPFLILAAISSVITYLVQQKGGSMAVIPLNERVANAIYSYFGYISKMFVPVHLAVFYPHPAGIIPFTEVIIFALILILLSVFLLYYGRQHKYLAFGWLWYLGTLVPVIGLVQVGAQAMADRYTYIPLIGLFTIIAFGAADLALVISYKRLRLWILGLASCFLCLACIITTSTQLNYWQDSFTLFDHTLAVTKNNSVILNNYANLLSDLGRNQEAAARFAEVLKFLPNSSDVHNNLGKTLVDLDRLDEGVAQYKKAIELDPYSTVARYNLAVVLAKQGKYNEAIEQYEICLGQGKGKIDTAEILSNLAFALTHVGKHNQAVQYYYEALRLNPDDVIVHGRLALALSAIGKADEAIEQCLIVLKSRPNDFEMYNNLGILFQSKGQYDKAAEYFKKALLINPDFHPARENLNKLSQTQP